MRVLLLIVLLSFDQGALEEVESVVLNALDLLLTFVPLANFLFLHQLATEGEAGFV